MNTCHGCNTTWTARGAAHCGACHATFSAVGLFDRHRHTRGEHGGCLNPTTLDHIEHRDGMWRGPALDDNELRRVYGRKAPTE